MEIPAGSVLVLAMSEKMGAVILLKNVPYQNTGSRKRGVGEI
jgi:hypothetical protein